MKLEAVNTNLTTYLAIYGAGVSTLALLWNFWRAYRDRPHIAVKIQARENFEDDGFGAIMFELRNRGGKPTTIEEIELVKYQDGFWGFRGFPETTQYTSVAHKRTVKLPYVLKPGEVWKAYSPVETERVVLGPDKNRLINSRKLFYRVKCAHTDRMLRGKILPERDGF